MKLRQIITVALLGMSFINSDLAGKYAEAFVQKYAKEALLESLEEFFHDIDEGFDAEGQDFFNPEVREIRDRIILAKMNSPVKSYIDDWSNGLRPTRFHIEEIKGVQALKAFVLKQLSVEWALENILSRELCSQITALDLSASTNICGHWENARSSYALLVRMVSHYDNTVYAKEAIHALLLFPNLKTLSINYSFRSNLTQGCIEKMGAFLSMLKQHSGLKVIEILQSEMDWNKSLIEKIQEIRPDIEIKLDCYFGGERHPKEEIILKVQKDPLIKIVQIDRSDWGSEDVQDLEESLQKIRLGAVVRFLQR